MIELGMHTDNWRQLSGNFEMAIDAAIKISLLGVLVALSFQIIRPFVMPVLWGVIIVVALGPMVEKLINLFGGRRKLAITLFTLVAIAILVVPAYFLVRSSFDGVQAFTEDLRENTIDLPPAPERIAEIPLVGEKITGIWNLAATDLEKAIKPAQDAVAARRRRRAK